ncbi:MAG: DUF885 family protein [Elusimicrobiaceae bacterium]|nr:DUF885 family protein [Elusimicrobiaceae bacterium]
MKKTLSTLLLIGVLLGVVNFSFALTAKEENLLINDDQIFSLANKYTSIVHALFDEEAVRLGLTGHRNEIIKRDTQNEITKIKALNSLKASLDNIKPSSLSSYVQADYYTLKELVSLKYFNTEIKKQFETDPMWYLESMDVVYELLLKDFLPTQERLDYAFKRLEAIPDILADAQDNLKNPSELSIQLAIEKVNLEVTNMQSIISLVQRISNDKLTKNEINQLTKKATTALNSYKTFLQKKLDEKNHQDFRIGSNDYEYLYQEVYMIPSRYGKLESILWKNLDQAQQSLLEWITPKVIASLTDEEKEERLSNNKINIYPKDYYLISKNYKNAPEYDQILKTYSKEVRNADEFFVTKQLFPTLSLPIVITSAPPILRSMPSKVTVYPPVPLSEKRTGDVLISLPKKVNLNKTEYNANYNYGKIKFSSAEYITPGQTLIYSVEPANLSLLCKLSDDIFYTHGWIKYALDTAYENDFFSKDEDKLNYLWFNYKKAIYAIVDYELQTRVFDLQSSLDFIKNSGIEEKEAVSYLNYLALKPFDAVSYIIGAQEFERLRIKYQKKQKSDFNFVTFHTRILSVGRIPLIALENTLEKAYAKKETDSLFSLTYF